MLLRNSNIRGTASRLQCFCRTRLSKPQNLEKKRRGAHHISVKITPWALVCMFSAQDRCPISDPAGEAVRASQVPRYKALAGLGVTEEHLPPLACVECRTRAKAREKPEGLRCKYGVTKFGVAERSERVSPSSFSARHWFHGRYPILPASSRTWDVLAQYGMAFAPSLKNESEGQRLPLEWLLSLATQCIKPVCTGACEHSTPPLSDAC
jgi:hypothetical protein